MDMPKRGHELSSHNQNGAIMRIKPLSAMLLAGLGLVGFMARRRTLQRA